MKNYWYSSHNSIALSVLYVREANYGKTASNPNSPDFSLDFKDCSGHHKLASL